MQALFLIVELFTNRRNFLFCYIWYQYLIMRYMQDRNGYLKDAFKNLDNQILSILNFRFVPNVIRNVYSKLKEILYNQIPVAGQPMPSMIPKCTIM